MSKFAIYTENEVINVIEADSQEIAELVTGLSAILIADIPIGVGWKKINNKWFPPKPFDSWIWDEAIYYWQPPVSYPSDNKGYYWSEEELAWKEIVE